MYNLMEYNDNYSDTLGNLWQFKRDEVPAVNDELSLISLNHLNTKQLM